MAKILQLSVLADLITETQTALSAGKAVERFKKDGSTVAVDPQNVKDAVAALKDAKTKLARICQQGVLGVKVT